jgi:phytoene dehydrogenase-like protein
MARVVVIGGGFGGLACALRLAKLGHAVTLVEERELGGALAPFTEDGYSWDTAAHTLLPAVVRDLFRKTGRPLDRELALEQLDCLREHWFADGTSVVHAAGRTTQYDAFEALGSGLGTRWVAHVAAYADDWEVIRRRYAEVAWDPADVPRDLADRFDSRETLHRRLRRLGDERLRQVAAHPFATDGHDVRDVPAWAGLTAYIEQRFGAWAFVGGTGKLLDALVRRLDTRKVEVVRGRARDVVVRDGRAAAVTTTAGEIDADVVVSAVDPRTLPALATFVRRTTPAIPAPTTYLGLEGEVRDLPHELVVHGEQTLVLRTRGVAPEGHHAWTVQTRGTREDDPLVALARHGLDVRGQVVTRVDRSPRDLVEAWGGSPLGVVWQGRATVRRRLGPRTPIDGVYAAGSHAAPGSGLPYVGLSAALVAQAVGPAR